VISGAFGLFRKEYLLAIGGYRLESIVEDMDLVVRLHRYLRQKKIKYEISFIPDPVAWTEVPESGRILGRQRERWHRGLISAMWQYRGMLFNPRYGRVGLVAVPFFALGEMLAPLIELLKQRPEPIRMLVINRDRLFQPVALAARLVVHPTSH